MPALGQGDARVQVYTSRRRWTSTPMGKMDRRTDGRNGPTQMAQMDCRRLRYADNPPFVLGLVISQRLIQADDPKVLQKWGMHPRSGAGRSGACTSGGLSIPQLQ